MVLVVKPYYYYWWISEAKIEAALVAWVGEFFPVAVVVAVVLVVLVSPYYYCWGISEAKIGAVLVAAWVGGISLH